MSTAAPAAMTRPQAGSVKTQDAAMAKWDQPTDKKGLEALGEIVKLQLVKALPSFMANEATASRLVRCLITECQSNPALLECTPISLFSCCIRAGQLGLEIGGPLGRAYLIPFRNKHNGGKKEAQLIPGYKGLIELAHRSGMIKRITPVTVRKGDLYVVRRGLNQDLIHEPIQGNVAPAVAYYVVIELMTGGKDFEEFTVEQAIEHRNKYAMSSSSTSPWQDIQIEIEKGTGKFTKVLPGEGFNAMACKTLIRRFMKRTPMSAELNTATNLEDDAENNKAQVVPRITGEMPDLLGPGPEPEEAPDKAEELEDRLKAEQAAGGGDPKAVDFLTPAIKAYEEAGGEPQELADLLGVKLKDIRASTGADRAKYTDAFNKATAAATAENTK